MNKLAQSKFDEIWEKADQIPGSFTYLSGKKLFECAGGYAQGAVAIAEVGVDQGRSASILLHAMRSPGGKLWLIDSWESVLAANYDKVIDVVSRFKQPGTKVQVLRMKSVDAAAQVQEMLDLVHIDADHYGDAPANDCKMWLPKLKPGGIACFHDYDSNFPAVNPAVDKYTKGWEDLGVWDGLAIRRKP